MPNSADINSKNTHTWLQNARCPITWNPFNCPLSPTTRSQSLLAKFEVQHKHFYLHDWYSLLVRWYGLSKHNYIDDTYFVKLQCVGGEGGLMCFQLVFIWTALAWFFVKFYVLNRSLFLFFFPLFIYKYMCDGTVSGWDVQEIAFCILIGMGEGCDLCEKIYIHAYSVVDQSTQPTVWTIYVDLWLLDVTIVSARSSIIHRGQIKQVFGFSGRHVLVVVFDDCFSHNPLAIRSLMILAWRSVDLLLSWLIWSICFLINESLYACKHNHFKIVVICKNVFKYVLIGLIICPFNAIFGTI